jgi:hypothetical protein
MRIRRPFLPPKPLPPKSQHAWESVIRPSNASARRVHAVPLRNRIPTDSTLLRNTEKCPIGKWVHPAERLLPHPSTSGNLFGPTHARQLTVFCIALTDNVKKKMSKIHNDWMLIYIWMSKYGCYILPARPFLRSPDACALSSVPLVSKRIDFYANM